MATHYKYIFLFFYFIFIGKYTFAQEKPEEWDLTTCIDYALKENIQIQKDRISLEQNKINTLQAKSQLFPTLSASTSHNIVNYPMLENERKSTTTYSGNYGINSSLTLFDGGKRYKNIRQQKLQEESQNYNIETSQEDIKISVTTAYLQILYALESIKINENSLEISEAQRDRAKELLNAGSISKSDYAQLEAQCSSDKYNLIIAQNNLSDMRLQLKQLLELDITDEIQIKIPEINDSEIMQILPDKESIYTTALASRPEIKNAKINTQIAELEHSIAKVGYYPTLNLNAGIGTDHSSSSDYVFGNQMKYNFNESIGLTLNFSIFNNRETKSAIEKAKLNIQTSKLDILETEKNLLKIIESVYLDVIAAQNKYLAAEEKLKSAEISYELIEQKFLLGMKNPFELLSEKNNLLTARQEKIQAKYMAILNIQLLQLYQNLPMGIVE